MSGELTVLEDGDMVVASRDMNEAELRDLTGASKEATAESVSVTPEPVEERTSATDDEPAPVPEKPAAATERDAQGRFTKPAEKEAKPPAERRGESIQARIDRLRYEQGEEERRLERLRAERQSLEQQPKPTPTPAPTVDAPLSAAETSAGVLGYDQFLADYVKQHPEGTPGHTYEKAVTAYQDYRETQFMARWKQEQAKDAATQEQGQLVHAHDARLSALRDATPDFDTAAQAANAYLAQHGVTELPAVMKEAILRSDKSEHIVRDLSLHPEIALQWARDTTNQPVTPAAVKMMRTVLESRLPQTAPAPPTGPGTAPRLSRSNPPPKPVGSSPNTPDASLDELSYDSFKEQFDKKIWKRGGH